MFSEEEISRVEEAVNRLGSQIAAANELGMSRNAVQRRLYASRKQDDFLERKAQELGFDASQVSSYWSKDKEGSFHVKRPYEQIDIAAVIKEALASDMPKAQAEITPPMGNENLLNCFVISDFHLGMLADASETGGADWDLKIAEDLLIKWFDEAILRSPNADTAILVQLGDMLHYDSMDSVTPAHRNVLDADSRPQKMIRTLIRVMRKIVSMLLQKHKHVHFINADANHDPLSSAWMRESWAAFYEDEPRITVEDSADTYYAYPFGKTSLYFHHGHKRKLSDIDHVFVAKFRDIYGSTKHSYGHVGHLHTAAVKESNLMIIEQHATLAPEDAYAAKGGWMHKRNAKVITYHKEYGEVSRLTISPEMLKGGENLSTD